MVLPSSEMHATIATGQMTTQPQVTPSSETTNELVTLAPEYQAASL